MQPVLYTGNTSAASITTLNASKLVANLLGNEQAATTIVGPTGTSGDAARSAGRRVDRMSLWLGRRVRERSQSASGERVSPQDTVDETAPCDNGVGSIHTTGTVSNTDYTGTLTLVFSGCLVDTSTLDGTATLRVDAFDLGFGVPTDFTLSFVRLAIRGTGLSVDSGGSLRMQVDLAGKTETLTSNLVSIDNLAARQSKTENLVLASRYDNGVSPNSFTAIVSGRIYDQVHGYVDAATPVPLAFATPNQLFPDRGQIVLTGQSQHRIRATALSTAVVRLELDLGGGYPIGEFAVVGWTQLAGPAGADIGDDDNDGLHNSWEAANGLDPNSASDAATDSDADGNSNIREYYAGADPRSAGPVVVPDATVEAAPFFAAATGYPAGTASTAIAVGDFNGDGQPDLVLSHWSDASVSLMLGNGAGAFGAPAAFPVGANPWALATGDFNADGKLDLAVANFGGPSVSILLGNGSGGFGAPADIALAGQLNPTAIAVGDFNNDGTPDLAVTMAYGFSNTTPGHVAILLGNGAGGFGAPANSAVGGTPAWVATGDFNGDGKLDLAVANMLVGTVSVLLGDGAGSFVAAPDLVIDGRPGAVVVGDFNGDGKTDLAVMVNSSVLNAAGVAVFSGSGTGTFGSATTLVLDRANGAFLTGLALVDFNADGRLDLAVSDQRENRAFVLLGDGAGSFGMTNYDVSLAGAPDGLAAGDFNGDGRPDLVAATGDGTNAATASVSLNTLP
ncbi:MAG: VCBS repeat-containing protein [Burkholderiaceae bacterium]|nr:VCBS repeat-containing protein [Burkholderiaceae bacterium]